MAYEQSVLLTGQVHTIITPIRTHAVALFIFIYVPDF